MCFSPPASNSFRGLVIIPEDIMPQAPDNVPQHIAVIMDGNGRWARQKNMPRLEGHRKGYLALRDFVYAANDLGIRYITAYAFSSENWKRPKEEVNGLMKLIEFALKAELNSMKKEGVRIMMTGRRDAVPQWLLDQMQEDEDATKDNSKILLNLAINYGGRNEIVDAAKQAAQMAVEGKISPDGIDEETIGSLLYHPELPDPDLLIRTAGEMRISNFLLWQTAYTEIYVTDTLWPDMNKQELEKAIASYQTRTRKFGKVVEQA